MLNVVYVHDGRIHMDEIFAVSCLSFAKKWFPKKDFIMNRVPHEIAINLAKNNKNHLDYFVDCGGRYDGSDKFFDHHQKTMAPSECASTLIVDHFKELHPLKTDPVLERIRIEDTEGTIALRKTLNISKDIILDPVTQIWKAKFKSKNWNTVVEDCMFYIEDTLSKKALEEIRKEELEECISIVADKDIKVVCMIITRRFDKYQNLGVEDLADKKLVDMYNNYTDNDNYTRIVRITKLGLKKNLHSKTLRLYDTKGVISVHRNGLFVMYNPNEIDLETILTKFL